MSDADLVAQVLRRVYTTVIDLYAEDHQDGYRTPESDAVEVITLALADAFTRRYGPTFDANRFLSRAGMTVRRLTA